MSTRGAIVRVFGDGFKGVYHHWDSYPEGLGQTLWELFHEQFGQDVERMLKFLIDEHPAGWSTLNGADFSMMPGYVELGRKIDSPDERRGPECYCHGDRSEEGNEVTEKDAAGIGVEWVYAFRDTVMIVLSSYNEDGHKMIGMFGMGNENARWRIVTQIDLLGEEPDWEMIKKDGKVVVNAERKK
ncbi:hypothetical protein LCGC14_0262530 [marine sediment metagenome]|uniref:Uncharacterized protein n=1 Tax=marine sediment metagenome TaxID=412755 RepID=A0A0F9U5V2_9ZZZZ